MRLLVLGGTQFVGRAIAEAALAAGHELTLFHRGRTGASVLPGVEHVHGDRDGGLAPLAGRTWDACVDSCGYVPRVVAQSVELLRGAVDRYAFVSTIAVYRDLTRGPREGDPLAEAVDPGSEDVSQSYGGLKALCERAVDEGFGERALHVRPGFVAGAHDPTGRFTWWVRRAALGGEMLVPEALAGGLQFVDARDLGEFTVHALERGLGGAYNVTGPEPAATLLDVVRAAGPAEPVVVPDAFLAKHVEDGRTLPFWYPGLGFAGLMRADVARAGAAGLRSRRLADTVRDVLGAALVQGVGLTPEREAELLAAWRAEG